MYSVNMKELIFHLYFELRLALCFSVEAVVRKLIYWSTFSKDIIRFSLDIFLTV